MAFTFNATPTTDRDHLRLAIGDTTSGDGPAPDHSNLTDAILDFFLDTGGGVAGAAAMAFDHLAALWISRPIFGPGELSTVHTNLARDYQRLADIWRARSSDPDAGGTVTITTFTKSDGYTSTGTDYT